MAPFSIIAQLIRVLEKYLLALKCLLAAAALNKDHRKVHEQIVRFRLALDKDMDDVPPKSLDIIKSEFNLLPPSISPTQYNDEYLTKHKDSAQSTLSVMRARKLLIPQSVSNYEKDVVAVIKLPTITIQEASEALSLLSLWQSTEATSFRASAAAKWPKATVFSAAS